MSKKHQRPPRENAIPDYNSLFADCREHPQNIAGRILKSLLKSNFKGFLISTCLFIVKHCPTWIVPIATANVINLANDPENNTLGALILNGVVLCVLIVQNIFTHTLYVKYSSRILRNIGAGFRNSLIRKLQNLSITYHKELESGKLQSKFIRDTETIENFLNQLMMNLLPCIITLIVTIAITVSKSLVVTGFFVILVPLNILVVSLFRKKLRRSNRIFRSEVENISSKISNMIEMIPVTKAHGLENVEIENLETNIKQLRGSGLTLDKFNAVFGSTAWVVSMASSAICLTFTGILAYLGKMEVGDIVMFQTYFSTITSSVQALLNIYPEFLKGMESIRSVSEIMISDNIEHNDNKIKLRYVHGTVQFEDVSYKYPDSDEYVIKHFSLDVEQGECVAFVGASGSGKSTIMNMIIGFLMPTDGALKIDGKPIEALNLQDYRHFVSVVPQNCILFKGTIRENITYGMRHVSEEQIQRVLDLANIREFVDKLPEGLETQVGEHGGNLSGGQKQRISIARALIRDPKIIILDEATSALDNISEYHVQKAMSSLIKDRTTFIVAHRLSTIRDADKIVVMENGEAVEVGTYTELMEKQGKFFELKTLSELTDKME